MESWSIKMWHIFVLTLLMRVAARSEKISEYRLPTNFKPTNYRLNIITHLDDKFIFEGVVNIKVSAFDEQLNIELIEFFVIF